MLLASRIFEYPIYTNVQTYQVEMFSFLLFDKVGTLFCNLKTKVNSTILEIIIMCA